MELTMRRNGVVEGCPEERRTKKGRGEQSYKSQWLHQSPLQINIRQHGLAVATLSEASMGQ
jgi:hypothetical protein